MALSASSSMQTFAFSQDFAMDKRIVAPNHIFSRFRHAHFFANIPDAVSPEFTMHKRILAKIPNAFSQDFAMDTRIVAKIPNAFCQGFDI